jgi:hypothetical protein
VTVAAAETLTASWLPALSVEKYLTSSPSASVGLLAGS